jgi:hypothetical protein
MRRYMRIQKTNKKKARKELGMKFLPHLKKKGKYIKNKYFSRKKLNKIFSRTIKILSKKFKKNK